MSKNKFVIAVVVIGFVCFFLFKRNLNDENQISLKEVKELKEELVSNDPSSVFSKKEKKLEQEQKVKVFSGKPLVKKEIVKIENAKEPQGFMECLKKHEKIISDNKFYERNKEDLSEAIGEWFFDSTKNLDLSMKRSVGETLILGLRFSGLNMLGKDKSKLNKALGKELILEAAHMNEKNSAPWVYLLKLARDEGLSEEVKFYKDKINQTDHFNDHSLELGRVLYSKVKTPLDFLEATLFLSPVITNIIDIKKALLEESVAKPSMQIVKSALRKDRFIDAVDWHKFEYGVALSTLRDLGKTVDKYPTSKELLSKETAELFRAVNSFGGSCDFNEFESYTKIIRGLNL